MKRILFSLWVAATLAAPLVSGPGSCSADAGRAFPLAEIGPDGEERKALFE